MTDADDLRGKLTEALCQLWEIYDPVYDGGTVETAVESAKWNVDALMPMVRDALVAEGIRQKRRANDMKAERDAAFAKLNAMRQLHRKMTDDEGPYCYQCCEPYPCATIRILDGDDT